MVLSFLFCARHGVPFYAQCLLTHLLLTGSLLLRLAAQEIFDSVCFVLLEIIVEKLQLISISVLCLFHVVRLGQLPLRRSKKIQIVKSYTCKTYLRYTTEKKSIAKASGASQLLEPIPGKVPIKI
jgi:hypothetical protein